MSPTSADGNRPTIPREIREAAAGWLVRREEGLTEEEQSELTAWLASDERHARALAEVDRSSRLFDRLAATDRGTFDISAVVAVERRRRTSMLVPWLAAAALFVLGVFWWRSADPSHHRQVATTQIGAQRKLTLPDGSDIRLNTDSSVEVVFSATERRLRLVRGEAYFRVAKDSRRPFIVTAGRVDVRAVGTEFNVRLESSAVEVIVTEGRVRLHDAITGGQLLAPLSTSAEDDPRLGPLLSAGQRVSLAATAMKPATAEPKIETTTPNEAERLLAWREQRLVFVSTPLSDVVAQFNRYNEHKLVIDGARLKDLRFGGRFRPDGYEAFVQLLESNFGVTVERRAKDTLLREAR